MSLANEELDELQVIERFTGGNACASATCQQEDTVEPAIFGVLPWQSLLARKCT
jgi:hypothetical protein